MAEKAADATTGATAPPVGPAPTGPTAETDPGDGASLPDVVPRRRVSVWLRYVIGIALGAAALWAVSGQRGELVGATKELSHLNPFWLLAAALAEVASFVSFARMQQRLLSAAAVRIGNGRVLVLTVAASAIASSIPAGPAIATVYAYRQYRRAGAEDSIAGWGLVATLLCSALGLALVAVAGVLVAERQGAALDLVGVTIGVLLVAVVAVVVFSRRSIVGALVLGGIRLVKRLTGFPRQRRGAAQPHRPSALAGSPHVA